MKHRPLFLALALAATAFVRAQDAAIPVAEDPAHPPGMLGVHLHEVYPEDVASLQLPGTSGAVVDEVLAGGAADLAGVKIFDVVLAFNGQRVDSARALQRMVRETPAGREVALTVFRGGENVELKATLQGAPEQGATPSAVSGAGMDPADFADLLRKNPWIVRQAEGRRLGATVQAVQPQLAAYLNLKPGNGLLVLDVQATAPGGRAGLQANDILLSLNDVPVTGTKDLTAQLDALVGNEAKFEVLRQGKALVLTVRFAPLTPDDGESL